MMELTKFQIAAIKRTAQNVNPMMNKLNRIYDKMRDLQLEADGLIQIIDQYESPIKAMTGGYTSSDLVEKKKDEKGVVTYALKEVPAFEENVGVADVDFEATAPQVEVEHGVDVLGIN